MSVYSKNKLNINAQNEAWYKIFNLIPEDKNILDIGCSSGNLGAVLIREKNAKVFGVDIDKKDVNLAKKQLTEAKVVDLEKDDFSDLGKFDVVIMADVIEHLVDPVAVLKKIKKNLKKNGIFIFSVPNMANSTIRIHLLSGRFEYKDWGLLDKTHIHFYDYNQLNKVFNEAGYEVVHMDNTIRQIPKNILKKELEKIGLDLSESFYQHMLEPESITYQFIGVAKVSDISADMKLATTSSLDCINEEIDGIRKLNQDEIDRHRDIISSLQATIKEREKDIQRLSNEAAAIKNSKAWKTIELIRKFKKRLKRN